MTKEEAIQATRAGAIAACISAAVTAGLFLTAYFTEAERFETLGFLNNPTLLFDVVLLLVLAWLVYKKSRVASAFLLLYFVVSKVFMFLETGKVSGIFITIAFLFFYTRAAWGTIIFHRYEKQDNPNYKKTSKWIIIPSIFTSMILLGLMIVGLLTMTSTYLPTEVLPGKRLHESHVQKLVDAGIVSSVGEIEQFYSTAFKDIEADGTILQKDKVLIYFKGDDEELEVYEMSFEEIKSIETVTEGNFIEDAVYKLSGDDPDNWIQISLSTESGGHTRFMDVVRARVTK